MSNVAVPLTGSAEAKARSRAAAHDVEQAHP